MSADRCALIFGFIFLLFFFGAVRWTELTWPVFSF